MRRRDGSPLWVVGEQPAAILHRIDLTSKASSGSYSEAWLQKLLQAHPEVFPIDQIEPGFGSLIPLCCELPLVFSGDKSGALDNLFTTTEGGLVFVETKLWRNPEARRSVVAQAMEYAAAIFGMNYSELELAVIKARKAVGLSTSSVHQIVSKSFEGLDEAEFIDAVSRNLERGRAIIAIVGDGIREDVQPLIKLLQTHAGHRFTFALVELAIYETPSPDTRIIVPSVIAQTTLIERGVIRIEKNNALDLRVKVAEAIILPVSGSINRPISIGEDEFFELLAERQSTYPQLLKTFLAKAEALGVYVERRGGLNLKHSSPEGQPLNMGNIRKNGFFDTSPATWWGRTAAGQVYNESLAKRVGGSVVASKNGEEANFRNATGKIPQLSDLLPQHEQAWLDAMEKYIHDSF